MIHLTLTGPSAGYPLCGVNRAAATAKGDSFVHAAWAAKREGFCPVCVAAWDRSAEEDAPEGSGFVLWTRARGGVWESRENLFGRFTSERAASDCAQRAWEPADNVSWRVLAVGSMAPIDTPESTLGQLGLF